MSTNDKEMAERIGRLARDCGGFERHTETDYVSRVDYVFTQDCLLTFVRAIQQDALNKKHEHFEAWALTDDGNCSRLDLRKGIDGEYMDPLVARDFLVWQAAQQPQPITRVSNDYTPDGNSCRIEDYLPAGTKLYAAAPAKPADERKDAARLDWLEQHDGRFYNMDKISSVVGEGFSSDGYRTRTNSLRDAIDNAIRALAEKGERNADN